MCEVVEPWRQQHTTAAPRSTWVQSYPTIPSPMAFGFTSFRLCMLHVRTVEGTRTCGYLDFLCGGHKARFAAEKPPKI